MRTLFITNSYLDGNGGGIYASRTHINLFAELSENLTLVYPYQEGHEPQGINIENIELIPVVDDRSNIRKLADLCLGKVHRFKLDELFFDRDRFDVVVFDSSVTSSGFVKAFKKAGVRIITIHHNYQIEYLRGDGDLLTLPIELLWTRIYERESVRNSDINITLTYQDVELLKQNYSQQAKFEVLGVYEYQMKQLPTLSVEERRHRYVITGGLGSKQTEESLLRWLKKYLPLLKKKDPYAEITIAGSNPSERLTKSIVESGCKLIPSPEDMQPILQDADYYICPIDCGGGLKLRNLDGLKFGLPVLTHSISARGYEKMEKEGLLFEYYDVQSFENGIDQLRNVSLSRYEIQKRYYANFCFETGVERLRSILLADGLCK